MRSLKLLIPLLCISMFAVDKAQADRDTDGAQHMKANGYYFRETTDRDWQLKIVGRIPSLPGCYYLLHDVNGKLLLRTHVKQGTYTEEKPLIFNIPKDGKTGDYRLVVIGQQEDMLGPRMPISNLPNEVYGVNYFTAGHNNTPIYFKVPPGVEKRNIQAYKGNIRVYDGDKLVVDAKGYGELKRYNWSADFPVKAGVTYRIERETFYFRSEDGIYFTFDPTSWFHPDAKLNEHNWWELSE